MTDITFIRNFIRNSDGSVTVTSRAPSLKVDVVMTFDAQECREIASQAGLNIKDPIEKPHSHTWLAARDVKVYSPISVRWCKGCGTIQHLSFGGWEDKFKLYNEEINHGH